MTAYPVERLLALAVKARLDAELGAGLNLVGYGVKPAGGGWASSTPTPGTQFKGYAVIYPGQTGPTDGPATATSLDAVQGWQVTSVGSTAEQADAIRDRCRGALLGVALSVAGRSCAPVDLSDSQNVQRDTDVDPPLYYSADRYIAQTTPA